MTDHYRWHLSLQWVPPNPRIQPTRFAALSAISWKNSGHRLTPPAEVSTQPTLGRLESKGLRQCEGGYLS
jgi:hypothetical protein